MVCRIVHFECDKCHSRHSTYDEAYDCELGHITDAAIEATRKVIDEAFAKHFGKETP